MVAAGRRELARVHENQKVMSWTKFELSRTPTVAEIRKLGPVFRGLSPLKFSLRHSLSN